MENNPLPNFRLSRQSLLMLAVSQALLLSSGHLLAADSDQVLAEDGAEISINDREIETTGDGVSAIHARTGGKIQASNISVSTSGNAAYGVLVHGHGSELISTGRLSINTSGDGATGLRVGYYGQADVLRADIVTHGKNASGVYAFSEGKINLRGGSITTLGDGSAAILGWQYGEVVGRDLDISTTGNASHGVKAQSKASIDLSGSNVHTTGDRSSGVSAFSGSSIYLRNGSSIITRGKEAHGVHASGGSSLVTLSDSYVETFGEGSQGVLVEHGGRVDLDNSHIQTHGAGAVGAQLNGGSLALTGGSLQAQDAAAVNILGQGNTVAIDSAYVSSTAGPVIKLEAGAAANIVVRNGSTLSAGNGKGELLELAPDSELDMVVDNSVLHGNLTILDSSLVNVRLQNGTRFTGQMTDVAKLQLDSGVRWDINGDSRVKSLVLNGGLVNFNQSAGFHTLSMGELSGSGTFGLKLDMNNRQIDFLDVSGQASGSHLLSIQNSGAEPVPGFDPLQVVHTGGGEAKFAVLGNRVDLGAFSYGLEQQGDDWFLTSDDREVSPGTRSVQALFSSAPTVWYGEMSTLRNRMGEVRGSGQGGGWMRSYGNKYQVSGSSGLGYKQNQQGISLGADAPLAIAQGSLLVGVFGGYSQSDLSLSRGSAGTVDSFHLGTYGTWMGDDGYYVDAVLKLNQFKNQADVVMSDFSKAKGNYRNYGVGASLEAGRQIQLTEQVFIEPFAQLSAVAVQGQSFTLDSELQARNAATRSMVGKVGTTVEQRFELLRPYVKIAVAQEFARDNEVKVNGHTFKNDLHGTRGELGAGLAVSLSSNLQLHADFDYMKGRNIEQPWGANVGLRYAFD
jgi:outer membrane autotransporter protein